MKFTLRCYDKYDGYWFDISKASGVSLDEALMNWNECTDNGTKFLTYADGSYYAIFPADTKMIFR